MDKKEDTDDGSCSLTDKQPSHNYITTKLIIALILVKTSYCTGRRSLNSKTHPQSAPILGPKDTNTRVVAAPLQEELPLLLLKIDVQPSYSGVAGQSTSALYDTLLVTLVFTFPLLYSNMFLLCLNYYTYFQSLH